MTSGHRREEVPYDPLPAGDIYQPSPYDLVDQQRILFTALSVETRPAFPIAEARIQAVEQQLQVYADRDLIRSELITAKLGKFAPALLERSQLILECFETRDIDGFISEIEVMLFLVKEIQSLLELADHARDLTPPQLAVMKAVAPLYNSLQSAVTSLSKVYENDFSPTRVEEVFGEEIIETENTIKREVKAILEAIGKLDFSSDSHHINSQANLPWLFARALALESTEDGDAPSAQLLQRLGRRLNAEGSEDLPQPEQEASEPNENILKPVVAELQARVAELEQQLATKADIETDQNPDLEAQMTLFSEAVERLESSLASLQSLDPYSDISLTPPNQYEVGMDPEQKAELAVKTLKDLLAILPSLASDFTAVYINLHSKIGDIRIGNQRVGYVQRYSYDSLDKLVTSFFKNYSELIKYLVKFTYNGQIITNWVKEQIQKKEGRGMNFNSDLSFLTHNLEYLLKAINKFLRMSNEVKSARSKP